MTKLTGRVRIRKGRGKALGFPTANLDIQVDHIEEGVYLAYATIGDKPENLPSLAFVGNPKTFNEDLKQVEVYILNFNRDLYGETVGVELIRKTRDNIKYDSSAELVEQMKLDEAEAREYFRL